MDSVKIENSSQVGGDLIRVPLLQNKKIEDRGTSSTLRTFLVLIKSYVGSGLMGMPFAFLCGGFWPGLIALVVIGFVSTYCVRLLLDVKDKLKEKYLPEELSTFGEISEKILGKSGLYITNACIIFTQTGFSTAYLIFVGQNMSNLFPVFTHWQWVFVVSPLFIIICMIRRFKYLAPFGGIANVVIMITVIVVIWESFANELVHEKLTWRIVNRINWKSLPIFFGIAVYAFEGIGLVIDMEKSMKHPEQFEKCLWFATVLLIFIFAALGAVGYFAYQELTQNIILLNLPSNLLITKIIIFGMMLALLATYPVQMFPVFSLAENALFTLSTPYLELKRSILRIALVILTVGIANGIPHFGLFLSLVGSVGCSTIAFIIPTFIYWKMFNNRISVLHKIGLSGILFFALVASIITATVTIFDIIEIAK